MRRFKLTIEYDGTDFAGFQWQTGQRTVQAEIERAIERLTGERVRIEGAGRTDAGVHAAGQAISFSSEMKVPLARLCIALNSFLPRDIAARRAEEVEERFHARFSALSRSYLYVVRNEPLRSALWDRFALHYPYPLNAEVMHAAAQSLLGEQDFRAWGSEPPEKRTFRRILRIGVGRRGVFTLIRVDANAFLHGMVRTIAGTLLEVGSGRRDPADIARITESRDRRQAGPSAAARGLCLMRVKY